MLKAGRPLTLSRRAFHMIKPLPPDLRRNFSMASGPQGQALLRRWHPHTNTPLVVSAPLRPYTLHELATQVSLAGGLGFLSSTANDASELASAASVLASSRLSAHESSSNGRSSKAPLPIGMGYQCYQTKLSYAMDTLEDHPVSAIWLFAWKSDSELSDWISAMRSSFPSTPIYIQVCDVAQALGSVDLYSKVTGSTEGVALVVQGSDSGGHGAVHGAGLMTLLPEIRQEMQRLHGDSIPLLAAGGVISAPAAAASLALGADGVVLGTRVMASTEAKVPPGLKAYILAAKDGANSTTRTRLFDTIRGTADFPAYYDGRALMNQSVREERDGVGELVLTERYKEAMQSAGKLDTEEYGPDGRLTCYAGNGVGLVEKVMPVAMIVDEIHDGVRRIVDEIHDDVRKTADGRQARL